MSMRVRLLGKWNVVESRVVSRIDAYWVPDVGFVTVIDPLVRLFGGGKWLR